MPSPKTGAVKQDQLNRLAPAARDAALGDVVADLITTVNALRADLTTMRTRYNAALAKLDADAGVTDTNYTSLQQMPALTAAAVTPLDGR